MSQKTNPPTLMDRLPPGASPLKIHDSATGLTREINPVTPGHLGLYLCGPTVQGSPHIGHMRASLAFDVLVRWARFCGWKVTYVRNITDIDDKILAKSAESGTQWWAHAAHFEREFDAAYRALNCLPPDFEPRATGHVSDQIALVEALMDRGHAYSDGAGNVYFDVFSLPEYGALTRQNPADLESTEEEPPAGGAAGAAAQVTGGAASTATTDPAAAPAKRHPQDFALWKAPKPGEPATASWDAPWGRGRPGWHLECSAMSVRYLGSEFDIHGGGLDLRFPHHENELAQSCGAGWAFARTWMHNAWVVTKGEKMSKSLGNSVVVADMLTHTPAPVLRLALVGTHYRSTIEYSIQLVEQAAAIWAKFSGFLTRTAPLLGGEATDSVQVPQGFADALNDDLNVAGAMAQIHARVKDGNMALEAQDTAALTQAWREVRLMLQILGLDPLDPAWNQTGSQAGSGASGASVGGEETESKAPLAPLSYLVQYLLEQRETARGAREWAKADELRDLLQAAGIEVTDGVEGSAWRLKPPG